MKTPKPPLGFIPVDSEEAKGIGDGDRVNYSWVGDGAWRYDNDWMHAVRCMELSDPEDFHHVQLPPKVEWEEVWGWDYDSDHREFNLTHKGQKQGCLSYANLDEDDMDTIVAALNKMEGSNG